jgi:hypothetical protein
MIAPTACRRKGASDSRAVIIARRIVRGPLPGKKCNVTRSLAEIIIRPNFRPATALLDCDKQSLRWPGPFSSGFLSPQPPGAVGIGPVRRIVYPHPGPTKVGPSSFWGCCHFGARWREPEISCRYVPDSGPAPSGASLIDSADSQVLEVSEATYRPRRASGPVCRDCHPGRRPPRHRRPRGKYFPAAQSSCLNCRSSHLS